MTDRIAIEDTIEFLEEFVEDFSPVTGGSSRQTEAYLLQAIDGLETLRDNEEIIRKLVSIIDRSTSDIYDLVGSELYHVLEDGGYLW